MTDAADRLCRGIAAEFRRRLQGEYLPRIARCVDLLGDERLWQRPAANCNSVGNLLLHLCGNLTQWVLANFGAVADARDRPAEFAAQDGASGKDLVQRFGAVVDACCDVVDGLDATELLRERPVQVYRETGLSSVLHAMEHCSGHAGQIYYWTKQVTGLDLRFYDL